MLSENKLKIYFCWAFFICVKRLDTMARKLRNIKLKEISLVTAPANRQKFLIIKQENCPNCGGILKQMRIDEDKSCIQLKCSECENIYKNKLSKGRNVMETLINLLKEMFGEDVSEEQIKVIKALSDDARTALTDALDILSKYKEDMPKDLLDSVNALSKHAIGKVSSNSNDGKKEEEILKQFLEKCKKEIEEVEKSGRKLSKDYTQKIKSVIKSFNDMISVVKTLEALLPDEDKVSKSSDNGDKAEEIHKKEREMLVEEIKKSFIEELKKTNAAVVELSEATKKANETFETRLKTLEEVKGVRKGLDGEVGGKKDADTDLGDFPSISGQFVTEE